ncbi:hypothetical protein HK099_008087, partial [Clydaea vesicula]
MPSKEVITAISVTVLATVYLIKKKLLVKTSRLNVNFTCKCKKVSINLSSNSALHITCSCEDCKSFAHRLKKFNNNILNSKTDTAY